MMRAALALLLLACLVSPTRADSIDELCLRFTGTYFYAMCSDPELRALAREREKVLDETNAKLDPFAQRPLMAEDRGWVNSIAATCVPNAPPALPLASEIKNCMVRAVEARIAYLRAYSAPAIPGPSFDELLASLRPGQTTEAQAMAVLGPLLDAAEDRRGRGDVGFWVIGATGVAVLFGHDGKMIAVTVCSLSDMGNQTHSNAKGQVIERPESTPLCEMP
jgi:hypothetical protein